MFKTKYVYDSEKLVFRKDKNNFSLRFFSGVLVGVLFVSCLAFAMPENSKSDKPVNDKQLALVVSDTTIVEGNTPEESEEIKELDVLEIIDKYPFKYKDIVKAQALIETSHFKSKVYKDNNNAMGMRLPGQRLTLATGNKHKHATYDSYEDSIIDRLIYEALYLNKLNREQYFKYLDKVYARAEGETAYSDLIKKVIRQRNL